jgi:hypothetical protein
MRIGQMKVWMYPETAVRVDISVTGTWRNVRTIYARVSWQY